MHYCMAHYINLNCPVFLMFTVHILPCKYTVSAHCQWGYRSAGSCYSLRCSCSYPVGQSWHTRAGRTWGNGSPPGTVHIVLLHPSGWSETMRTDMSRHMTKSTKWHVHPARTQISLGIRPVWSESSLSAWGKLGSLATHWVHSEDSSDWVDAQADLSLRWAHSHFAGFVMRWLIWAN